MPEFKEILEQLRSLPLESDDTPLETIYDSLESSYNDVLEGSTTVISSKDQMIQNLESEVSRLKSKNYDLLMATPAQGDEGEDDADEAPPKPLGIDSLFRKEVRFR